MVALGTILDGASSCTRSEMGPCPFDAARAVPAGRAYYAGMPVRIRDARSQDELRGCNLATLRRVREPAVSRRWRRLGILRLRHVNAAAGAEAPATRIG